MEKLTAGLESIASGYLTSIKEMDKLELDADEVKKELNNYISMAKKEEKLLSSKLVAVRKEEEKIRDKFFDEKLFIQESKSNLLINLKDLTEKKILDINKKIQISEENVIKLEKEADVIKRKVKEVSSEYDLKLRNILSHLEFIDRKRFRYMKDLTKRFSQIQTNTAKMVIEQHGVVDTKIELLNEENEFNEYITSVKSIKPTSNIISKDSEQKLLVRIASQSWDFMKSASGTVKKTFESGEKFTDSLFPPKNISIDPEMEDSVLWMRAVDLLGPFKIISPETVLAYDIKPQKSITGYEWLTSALEFIASKPALIERIFVVKTPNDLGILELNMCIGGEFYKITIDDFFPASRDGNPLYSSTKSKDLWAMAIEKGVAKVCGTYKRMASSSFTIGDAFELLTGCPSFYQPVGISNTNHLWKPISNFTQSRNITCCLTLPFSETTATSIGLHPVYPYYLVGCLEMNGKKIVKLKCTRGPAEWKGDYSESDRVNWTPEYRNALGVDQSAQDGYFFMPFSDFCKYFDSMSSFKYDPLLARFQHRIPYPSPSDSSPPTNTVTEVSIETDQKDVYFGLHQKHDRFKGSPARSAMGFIVVRKQGSKIVGAVRLSTNPCNYSEGLSLRAGDYQIIPIVAQNAISVDVFGSGNAPNLTVVVHARGNVRMKTAEKVSIKMTPIQKSMVEQFLSGVIPKSPSLIMEEAKSAPQSPSVVGNFTPLQEEITEADNFLNQEITPEVTATQTIDESLQEEDSTQVIEKEELQAEQTVEEPHVEETTDLAQVKEDDNVIPSDDQEHFEEFE